MRSLLAADDPPLYGGDFHRLLHITTTVLHLVTFALQVRDSVLSVSYHL